MNNLSADRSDVINQLSKEAVDFHCHGVGRFDFTEIPQLDLEEIEDILSKRNHRTILTLYLPKPSFGKFLRLTESFQAGKEAGKFKHIMGFGLEGPILASHGGTPEEGLWTPTKREWKQIADCGKRGLVYVVLSPDAHLNGNDNQSDLDSEPYHVTWIAETLLEGGVLPAPGHFTKDNPKESAKLLQNMFDVVEAWGKSPSITDHLINDMPHNFKHAWRTPLEKSRRDEDIKLLDLDSWNLDNLEEKMGIVPAVMIRNARKGLVKICQNFDGEHVDLAIVKKTVELIGAENMLMMTDSIESRRLAGRNLTMQPGTELLYQAKGVVAAGSRNIEHQIKNMFSIGLTLKEIQLITDLNPKKVLEMRSEYAERGKHAEAGCI